MTEVSDILWTARNLRADPETQALGEDYPAIAMIAESYRMLQQSVESARYLVSSNAAKTMLAELECSLSDAAHDACLFSTTSRAKDAFDEAKVVPIKRPGAPALRVVK